MKPIRKIVLGAATLFPLALLLSFSGGATSFAGTALEPLEPELALERLRSAEEVVDFAKMRASAYPDLRNLIDRLDTETYRIVFIPGIMGSKIKIGDFEWGRDPVRAEKIVLDPEAAVPEGEILKEYSVSFLGVTVKKEDIYGKAYMQLEGIFGDRNLEFFGYDWRQDLDVTAERFEEFAQSTLKERKVIIIAHSMGGLMFWHWYNKSIQGRYGAARPFKLLAVILAGSPIKGSCEAARMLAKGYKAYRNEPTWKKTAYDIVFNETREAVLTFPSVWELMPTLHDQCLRFKSQTGTLHSRSLLKEWEKLFESKLRDYSKKTGMPGESDQERIANYKNRVRYAVERANAFRTQYYPLQHHDRVYYFYTASEELKIPRYYLLELDTEGCIQDIKECGEHHCVSGDGRVPKDSATNKGYRSLYNSVALQLNYGHGELLSDDRFVGFVEDHIPGMIEEDKSKEIAIFAASNERLLNEFVQGGYLVSPKSTDVSDETFSDEERRKIANLNLAVAGRMGMKPDAAGRKLEDDGGNFHGARVLYESMDVTREEDLDARTLNRWGYILLRQGQYAEAASVLERARKTSERRLDPYMTAELKEKMFNNLGTALFRTGRYREASEAYRMAPNNPIAVRNHALVNRVLLR